jgi:hypothetical protein
VVRAQGENLIRFELRHSVPDRQALAIDSAGAFLYFPNQLISLSGKCRGEP